MKKLTILVLLWAVLGGSSIAQEFSAQKEIKKYISERNKSDLKKLEKADKAMEGVNLIFAEADKYRQNIVTLETQAATANDKTKKKIQKKIKNLELKEASKRLTGSKELASVNKILFTVYKNNFKSARSKVAGDEAKMQEGRELEKEANDLYNKAKTKRIQSIKISDELKAYKILADADELENRALETQLKAYGLYLSWYGNTEEVVEETATEEPAAETKEIDEDLPNFVEVEKKTETENPTKEEYTSEAIEDPVLESNTEFPVRKIEEPKTQNILYKIQIAASRKPLTLSDLHEIYVYNLRYNNESENGYYKYSVGKFNTYQDAAAFKAKMNVPEAFIIAYRDGQKISIEEANPELVNKNAQESGSNKRVNAGGFGADYRIQISATRIPASKAELNKMNPTSKEVQIYKVGQWYKYTIGSFKTSYEATNFKNRYHLNGFVVRYVDGKEVK